MQSDKTIHAHLPEHHRHGAAGAEVSRDPRSQSHRCVRALMRAGGDAAGGPGRRPGRPPPPSRRVPRQSGSETQQ